jgi:hypothetical protein
MALLRIADYLQIQRDRAAPQLLKTRSLSSSISAKEWAKHHAILTTHQLVADPEALYIDANPESAAAFFGVRKLIDDIQDELDATWAVLGEIYGRYAPLNRLGLRIRRIRSSLDDVSDFITQKRPAYIPRKLSFEPAGTEMLELLVQPLYGDRPEIAIRELIQNAVDACLEREDYESRHGPCTPARSAWGVRVRFFENDKKTLCLEVADQGMGMTLDVAQNYFLRIGASFRNSDAWKREHLDHLGHSRVLRSGRFGVGVLAAFLMGPRIRVSTRHITSKDGFSFACQITDEVMEITPESRPVGTTITVEIDDRAVLEKLSQKEPWSSRGDWDWYCLSKPLVLRLKPLTDEPLLQGIHVPGKTTKGTLPAGWHRFIPRGFESVLWTYETVAQDQSSHEPLLIHNGIKVIEEYGRSALPNISVSPHSPSLEVSCPTIVVFDRDARLPLNLQRSRLAGEQFPFQDDLEREVATHLVRTLLTSLPQISGSITEALRGMRDIKLPPRNWPSTHTGWPPCIWSPNGWLPMDTSLISASPLDEIWIDPNHGVAAEYLAEKLLKHIPAYIGIPYTLGSKGGRTAWMRQMLDRQPAGWRPPFIHQLPVSGVRVFYESEYSKELNEKGQLPKYLWNTLKVEWQSGKWSAATTGSTPTFPLKFERMASVLGQHGGRAIAIVYLERGKKRKVAPDSPFAAAWKKSLKGKLLRP